MSAPITQEQCDQEAARITNGLVHPSAVQGGTSYTVVSTTTTGMIVVQFRRADSAFDLELLGYAQEAYANFMPRHEMAGNFDKLLVYTMNDVGGISMYLARDKLFKNNFSLLRETVKDFARFVTLHRVKGRD